MSLHHYHFALALSRGATLLVHDAVLTHNEADTLTRLLQGLADLGFLAAFVVRPAGAELGREGMIDALRKEFGLAVDAVLAAAPSPSEPPPAFLVPVWPFDHVRGERPASTARFLGLELEVIATPSDDEETGVELPGRVGLWLVHARPLCSDHFFQKVPATDH